MDSAGASRTGDADGLIASWPNGCPKVGDNRRYMQGYPKIASMRVLLYSESDDIY